MNMMSKLLRGSSPWAALAVDVVSQTILNLLVDVVVVVVESSRTDLDGDVVDVTSFSPLNKCRRRRRFAAIALFVVAAVAVVVVVLLVFLVLFGRLLPTKHS